MVGLAPMPNDCKDEILKPHLISPIRVFVLLLSKCYYRFFSNVFKMPLICDVNKSRDKYVSTSFSRWKLKESWGCSKRHGTAQADGTGSNEKI